MHPAALVLALAQVCVSEANFRRTPDCAAIVQRHRGVVERTGRPWLDVVREYSPRATDYCGARPDLPSCRVTRQIDRMTWIRGLRLDAREPHGWGTVTIPWARRREAWIARIAEVRSLLEVPRYPCIETPWHWCAKRGRIYSRAKRQMREVNCGVTIDAFFVPRD